MYLGPCYIYYQYIPLYTTVLESWVVELPLPLATCCLIKQCGEMSLMLQLSLAQTYKCWCSIGWWYRTPSKLYDKFIIWGRTLEACTRAIASLPGMCLKWCPSITMLCIFIPPPVHFLLVTSAWLEAPVSTLATLGISFCSSPCLSVGMWKICWMVSLASF